MMPEGVRVPVTPARPENPAIIGSTMVDTLLYHAVQNGEIPETALSINTPPSGIALRRALLPLLNGDDIARSLAIRQGRLSTNP